MSLFDTYIERILDSEGGYTNPKPDVDPGGETKFGISKRSYPNVDIANLTREQAIEIYRTDFWQRVHGDEIPAGLSFLALDFAVNSGIETAIRKLQLALGVADDGHWGPVTRGAVQGAPVARTAMLYTAARMDFQRRLSNWLPNSNGWTARNARNLVLAAGDIA